MSYFLLNDIALNGEEAGDYSLVPASFGIPDAVFSYGDATGLSPLSIGDARVKQGDDVEVLPESLSPVRFGEAVFVVGQPPPSIAFQASSISPLQIGVPSAFTSTTHPAQSLQPLSFGAPGATRSEFRAAAVSPLAIGVPAVAAGAQGSGALRPAALGVPELRVFFLAGSVSPVGIGKPGYMPGATVAEASWLAPVQIGTPGQFGSGFRARSICPVQIGRASLDRGAVC